MDIDRLPNCKELFIFDLDGTLADLNHRLPYIQAKPPNWDKFYDACVNDKPIQWVIDLFNICREYGIVVILSGRNDTVRKQTENWLLDHDIGYYYLLMRKDKDYRPDQILKKEMLDNFLRDKGYKVQFIVDDRQKVVDMWRANGYHVLQCNAWEEK